LNRFPTVTTALALSLCACAGVAAQPKPTFEAVSIKPVPAPTPQDGISGAFRPVFSFDATHLESRNFPLTVILARAFQVDLSQISAPDFASQTYFEVLAKAPAGTTREQLPEMLQAMLAERFKLTFHRETREYETTVITVGKSGMKLKRLPDDTKPSPRKADRQADGTTITTFTGTVASLFPVMSSFGGFPQMVDQTGLDGLYTWVLNQRPADPGETFQDVTHEAYGSMVESAGLKIEERKVPKDTIIVDHVEKTPTEN
jgi:uncharacterized protein (TIGR03435 family)